MTKGTDTRAKIVETALRSASMDGIEGITLGKVASDVGMSKSGLFAHFGSKEELQIATALAARERFINEVFRPALQAPRGYPRLMAICRTWLDYIKARVFPGGCFFAAASFEFDGRSGPVRDLIVGMMDGWIESREKAVRMAQEEGHLDRSVDAAQLAFELNALFFGANFSYYLRNDASAIDKAARAIEARLDGLRIGS